MPRGATPTLLLTRPLADSRRFAAMLPDLPAVISPILRIVPVPHDAERLAKAEALVFTSRHAIPAAGPGRGRSAFCVGSHTAEAARKAGFDVIQGPGDAAGLAALIPDRTMRLVHPHGTHLARRLPVEGMVVYDQVQWPLSNEATRLLAGDDPVIVPLFSPRSARLLADAVRSPRAPLWVAALSGAVLEMWDSPSDRAITAASPDADALAAAICRLRQAEQC
ncbi:uroporphyrinogen-III synthase [Paracoccus salsus]|uniref:uroporphyrinogen-III synthase n=1 Tax=Paracoccus salsus TaxID=2911061 RepID=UPI001F3275E1|nr:uroporphyrinogen-III synthase [Paracoccus salsus]MCF3973656.1 uroporphyrinogen-III synthase [Paracoccus salsus]